MQNKTSVYLFVLITLIVGVLIGMNTDKLKEISFQPARTVDTQVKQDTAGRQYSIKCDNGGAGVIDINLLTGSFTVVWWSGPGFSGGVGCKATPL